MGSVLVPSRMPADLPRPITDPTGRKRIYVNPAVIHVGSGSKLLRKIQFTNHTGDKARFWFPNGASIFVGPPPPYKDFSNPFVVDNDGKLEFDVLPDLEPCDYTYHVYCDAIGGEADGNSPPGISCP